MSRIDCTYQITLAQLAALADFVCYVDCRPYNSVCKAAHQIIGEVLGPDEALVYGAEDPDDEQEAA